MATTTEAKRQANATWYEKNKGKSRELNRAWRGSTPASALLYSCRKSAKARGLECSLTLEQVVELARPMVCSMTKLPLRWDKDGDSFRNPWGPSIDRLDNSRGYVPDNVRLVCCAFNIMRSDFSDDVVRTLARAVTENWND